VSIDIWAHGEVRLALNPARKFQCKKFQGISNVVAGRTVTLVRFPRHVAWKLSPAWDKHAAQAQHDEVLDGEDPLQVPSHEMLREGAFSDESFPSDTEFQALCIMAV